MQACTDRQKVFKNDLFTSVQNVRLHIKIRTEQTFSNFFIVLGFELLFQYFNDEKTPKTCLLMLIMVSGTRSNQKYCNLVWLAYNLFVFHFSKSHLRFLFCKFRFHANLFMAFLPIFFLAFCTTIKFLPSCTAFQFQYLLGMN